MPPKRTPKPHRLLQTLSQEEPSILEQKMVCSMCLKTFRAGDCEPDVDGDGSLGCPEPGCDGIMVELPQD